MASIRNLDWLRTVRVADFSSFGQKLYESISDIGQRIGNIEQQTNANQTGQPATPPAINSLSVTAQDGIFDAKISDTGSLYRGTEYFLEHSATPDFSQPHVIHLGPSRNWRGALGDVGRYWRAYSGYGTSHASAPVYHGGSATSPAIVQGGGASGPPLQSSAGSGTASNDGTQGGTGYGPVQFRGSKAPVR